MEIPQEDNQETQNLHGSVYFKKNIGQELFQMGRKKGELYSLEESQFDEQLDSELLEKWKLPSGEISKSDLYKDFVDI